VACLGLVRCPPPALAAGADWAAGPAGAGGAGCLAGDPWGYPGEHPRWGQPSPGRV